MMSAAYGADAATYEPAHNARDLLAEEVGRRFVRPAHFDAVERTTSNTVVVGPRGSGKTTLLKVLTIPALRAWASSPAHDATIPDYSAVFVATDRLFKRQLTPGTTPGDMKDIPSDVDLIGQAAFRAHVLRSLLATINDRISCDAEVLPLAASHLSPRQETKLAREIASLWHLDSTSGSLTSLRQQVRAWLADLGNLRQRLLRIGALDDPRLDSAVDLDFFTAVAASTAAFEDHADCTSIRWALLFDELELAQRSVLDSVAELLRTADERFLVKLSVTPFVDGIWYQDLLGDAEPGHDYEPVDLSNWNRQTLRAFSARLAKQIIEREEAPDLEPVDVFGRSAILAAPRGPTGGSAYEPGGERVTLLSELAATDGSFAAYLRRKSLDLSALDRLPTERRHETLRKLMHVAAIRHAYRPSDDGSRPRVSSNRLYSGVPLLYDLADGNPRRLIGMISAGLTRSNKSNRVTAATQSEVIADALARYRAYLAAQGPAFTASAAATADYRVASLVDVIGRAIRRSVLDDAFQPEPIGSFEVDEQSFKIAGRALALAINAGAIVEVHSRSTVQFSDSLVGRHFRLTYLLSPHYRLPVRLNRSVRLSRLLNEAQPASTNDLTHQLGIETAEPLWAQHDG